MTAHELARKLLAGPDLLVTFNYDDADDGFQVVEVDYARELAYYRDTQGRLQWLHAYQKTVTPVNCINLE